MIDLKVAPEASQRLWATLQDYQSPSVSHPGEVAIVIVAEVPFKVSYTTAISDGKLSTNLCADKPSQPGVFCVVETIPDETKLIASDIEEARS
jgi:hypothetical protein